MKFDIALRITPDFSIREYSHAAGITQTELARDVIAIAAQVRRIGNETRTLLALVAQLQNATRGASTVITSAVDAVANQAMRVADVSALERT
jgi:hypothetical protein